MRRTRAAAKHLLLARRERDVDLGEMPEFGLDAANAAMHVPERGEQLGDAELRQRARAAELQER